MKICVNCLYYSDVYTKATCRFFVKPEGVCGQNQKIVKKGEKCGLYAPRPKRKTILTVKDIDAAMEDVSALFDIFLNSV